MSEFTLMYVPAEWEQCFDYGEANKVEGAPQMFFYLDGKMLKSIQ